MGVFRTLSLVTLAVVILLLAYVFSSGSRLSSPEDATRFVLDDLSRDPAFAGRDALFLIHSANQSGDDWAVVSNIVLSPHSACPTVIVRTYNLLPLRRDVDKVAVSDCHFGVPITYREEAIIATRELPQARALQLDGASACAFALPLDAASVDNYCPGVDVNGLRALAESAPSARWLALWRVSDRSAAFALSSSGQVVAQSG